MPIHDGMPCRGYGRVRLVTDDQANIRFGGLARRHKYRTIYCSNPITRGTAVYDLSLRDDPIRCWQNRVGAAATATTTATYGEQTHGYGNIANSIQNSLLHAPLLN
jgi:hypothetical protein